MTPEQGAFLRRALPLRLRDLRVALDPPAGFDGCARLAAWATLQRGKPSASHDRLLQPAFGETALRILAFALATVDPHFFVLAKRMAAVSLIRHETHDLFFRQIFAALMVEEPPRRRSPTLARDVAIIAAVRIGQNAGWTPTETHGRASDDLRSGCGRIAETMGRFGAAVSYSAVEKVWRERHKRLIEADFSAEEASDFLEKLL